MNDRPIAIVTGAAPGIGGATACEFAARGYNVCLIGNNEAGVREVADEVRELGAEALVQIGDLTDLQFAESTIERTVQHWGSIEVLVNNAAWREPKTMREISLESWEQTLRICLTVPAFLSRWTARFMEQRGRGVIINVSSIQSQMVSGTSPAYCAAKGGLDSLTYELATLYGPLGIRVVAVNPGDIETNMGRDFKDAAGDSLLGAAREASTDMIPLRRSGKPREIARIIAFLASDDASYISGTTVVADGGWSQQLSPYSFKRRLMPQQF